MRKLLLLLFLCIAADSLYAVPNGIVLQQQLSPLHNLLHIEIDLNNTVGQTFDNITVAIVFAEESLYFIRPDSINSGSFAVTGNFEYGGQTSTWTTGDSSITNKQFHFLASAHAPGSFQLTIQVTDNQGMLHTYQSNNQTLTFPNTQVQTFTIPKNSSLQFNASETFVITPLLQPLSK
jgi:hypothetical protein